jgi:hypothetical protein
LLDRFALRLKQAGVQVIVIEGDYNPLALSEGNLRLRARARARLTGFDARHDNVRLIPREELMTFTPADYADGYHVSEPAGIEFVRRIFARLDADRPQAQAPRP